MAPPGRLDSVAHRRPLAGIGGQGPAHASQAGAGCRAEHRWVSGSAGSMRDAPRRRSTFRRKRFAALSPACRPCGRWARSQRTAPGRSSCAGARDLQPGRPSPVPQPARAGSWGKVTTARKGSTALMAIVPPQRCVCPSHSAARGAGALTPRPFKAESVQRKGGVPQLPKLLPRSGPGRLSRRRAEVTPALWRRAGADSMLQGSRHRSPAIRQAPCAVEGALLVRSRVIRAVGRRGAFCCYPGALAMAQVAHRAWGCDHPVQAPGRWGGAGWWTSIAGGIGQPLPGPAIARADCHRVRAGCAGRGRYGGQGGDPPP